MQLLSLHATSGFISPSAQKVLGMLLVKVVDSSPGWAGLVTKLSMSHTASMPAALLICPEVEHFSINSGKCV